MTRKRERANSFFDNLDKINDDENIFDYSFYLNLIKDKNDVINGFKKFKNIAKNHFFKNNEVLRLQDNNYICLLYTSPSPRDVRSSRMPSSA